MTIYLAGPITGDAGYRLKFAAVAYVIHKKEPDAAVLNPASLPAGMARSDYMAICLSMLMRADVVFLLPGWQTSGGAQIEKALAEYLKIRVIEIGEDLLQKFMEDLKT